MTSTHEDSPVTALVATHCCLCGRALTDAVSLERGIGPVCAEKHGVDGEHGATDWAAVARLVPAALVVEGDARRTANRVLYRVSASRDSAEVPALVEGLRALGFATVADRLTERLAEEGAVTVRREGDVLRVEAPFNPAFNEALRAAAPGRRWDREAKAWRVPATARAGLWSALREVFRGHAIVTDAGVRMIA